MIKLTDKIQRSFNLAGYSIKTQKAYLYSISNCKKYFRKPLIELTKEDLKNYFSNLVESRKSQTVIKHHYYALRFLFKKVFERDCPLQEVPAGKAEKKLPVILALEEIKSLLNESKTKKQKAIISVTYCGGLRLSEVHNLKISDIDSKRMMIRVCQGKGKKDRYTLLSKTTLAHLREYYVQYKPQVWLFNGRLRGTQLAHNSLQATFHQAKKRANITKKATFHTLRHSFATHLYEHGVGLAHIQRLMGHASIKTTMIYIHLAKGDVAQIKSPLDCSPE